MIQTDDVVLSVENIVVQYGGLRALRGVCLYVRQGEVLGIVGDNGAGKSTLIKVISGSQKPLSGVITMRRRVCGFENPRDASDAVVAIVYQDLVQPTERTVVDAFFLGRELLHQSWLGRLIGWLDRAARTSFTRVEGTLSAIRFRPALGGSGRGRAWQSGAVQVGASDDGRESVPVGIDAFICRLAISCDEPDRAIARATALLVPPASNAGPVPAVASPDRSIIELRPARFDADPGETTRGQHLQPTLVGVDYVVLTQPFDVFDEALLFFRSALGLRPQDREELSSRDGRLRSRAGSSSCGHSRIALNAATTGGSFDHLADREHVAFGCAEPPRTRRRI